MRCEERTTLLSTPDSLKPRLAVRKINADKRSRNRMTLRDHLAARALSSQPPHVMPERLCKQAERNDQTASLPRRGNTSAAATVSVMPWIAATVFRQ